MALLIVLAIIVLAWFICVSIIPRLVYYSQKDNHDLVTAVLLVLVLMVLWLIFGR